MVESDEKVERAILRALRRELNAKLAAITPAIRQRIQREVQRLIVSSPEFISLTSEGGQLRTEFGLENTNQMQVILDKWISSIAVEVEPVRATKAGLVGGLRIYGCGLRTFNDVLDDPASYYVTEKGDKIEFLKWLCLEGDRTIIRRFDVRPGNRFERVFISRTNSDLMKPSQDGKWAVPAWAAGYKDSNFVTRSLKGMDVSAIVREALR